MTYEPHPASRLLPPMGDVEIDVDTLTLPDGPEATTEDEDDE